MLRTATAEEILPFVERAMKYRRQGSDTTAQKLAQDGGFLLCEDGEPFLGFTLKAVGNEVWISSAFGHSQHDLIAVILELVEKCAVGFQSVAFQTIRPGLIRKAKRHGYHIAGSINEAVIMRKAIQ